MKNIAEDAFRRLRGLLRPNDSRIVLLVLDGLGGLPRRPGGHTELEKAKTPAMDALATEGITGLHVPVRPGFTPGSGPAHLSLFGYDPLSFTVGRGVLSAAGIDFDLQPGDVAARGNFCSVDERGNVTDRRAGRIDTDINRRLCKRLQQIHVDGADLFLKPIKQHRFLLVLRGEQLSEAIGDTDPHQTGVPPKDPAALHAEAEKTAERVRSFIRQARELLRGESPANMVLLRGFSTQPDWPSFNDVFGLHAAAVAQYPMYRGIARLLRMDVLPPADDRPEKMAARVRNRFSAFDFFFLHVKQTDSMGEDGDFEGKVRVIEKADQTVSHLMKIEPDVLIVTGDHSTPAVLRSHSWHPVPALLWSKTCRPDGVTRFGEQACIGGAMGPRFPATDLMPLALAHAGRLNKYGA